MKENSMLLVIYAMLSFILTAGIMMGDIISWEGLMCFSLTFSFWFLMLIGAWTMPKKKKPQDPYPQYDPEWENDVRRGR